MGPRESSCLDCNRELTLPTLTGQGSFIMVSVLLSHHRLRHTRLFGDLYPYDKSENIQTSKIMNILQYQS